MEENYYQPINCQYDILVFKLDIHNHQTFLGIGLFIITDLKLTRIKLHHFYFIVSCTNNLKILIVLKINVQFSSGTSCSKFSGTV